MEVGTGFLENFFNEVFGADGRAVNEVANTATKVISLLKTASVFKACPFLRLKQLEQAWVGVF